MNAAAFTTEIYVSTVSDVLRRVFGPVRNAPKRLGSRLNAQPRTVEGWIYGESGPRGRDLIVLMAECAELRAEVDRLINELQAAP